MIKVSPKLRKELDNKYKNLLIIPDMDGVLGHVHDQDYKQQLSVSNDFRISLWRERNGEVKIE